MSQRYRLRVTAALLGPGIEDHLAPGHVILEGTREELLAELDRGLTQAGAALDGMTAAQQAGLSCIRLPLGTHPMATFGLPGPMPLEAE